VVQDSAADTEVARQCEQLLKQEKWVDALTLADGLAQRFPLEEFPQRLRFVALHNLRRVDEAIAAASKAITLAAAPANAHYLLAKVLWEKHLDAEATSQLATAVALEPDVPLYRKFLAHVVMPKEIARAEELLRELVLQVPADAQVLNDLGCVTERTDLKQAREYYKRALSIDPAFEQARFNLRRLRWVWVPVRKFIVLASFAAIVLPGLAVIFSGLWTHSFSMVVSGILVPVAGLFALRQVFRMLNRFLARSPTPLRSLDPVPGD
jgi:Flp pilus assembly protein TadD